MLSESVQNEVIEILSSKKYWETAVIDLLNAMYAVLDEKGNIIEDCTAVIIYKKEKGIV